MVAKLQNVSRSWLLWPPVQVSLQAVYFCLSSNNQILASTFFFGRKDHTHSMFVCLCIGATRRMLSHIPSEASGRKVGLATPSISVCPPRKPKASVTDDRGMKRVTIILRNKLWDRFNVKRWIILDMYICAQMTLKIINAQLKTPRRGHLQAWKRVNVQYLSHPIKPLPAQWILGTHTKVLIKRCQMFLIEKTQTHTCLHTAQ